jgi:hypothetical protein
MSSAVFSKYFKGFGNGRTKEVPTPLRKHGLRVPVPNHIWNVVSVNPFLWSTGIHMGLTGTQRHIEYRRLLRRELAITELRYLDASGKEQLHVSRLGMDKVGSGDGFSSAPEFLQAKAGKTYHGPVYFRRGAEPYMSISDSGAGSQERTADDEHRGQPLASSRCLYELGSPLFPTG